MTALDLPNSSCNNLRMLQGEGVVRRMHINARAEKPT